VRHFLKLLLCACFCAAAQEPSNLPDARESERKAYDELYSKSSDMFSIAPNAFVMRMLHGRKPGRALDVGMGQGRNALWLASEGWAVTGFDISVAGITTARKEAENRGLRIETFVMPYEDFDWGREKWDLILFSYFFPTAALPKVWDALKARWPDSGRGISHRHSQGPAAWRRVSQQRTVPGIEGLSDARV